MSIKQQTFAGEDTKTLSQNKLSHFQSTPDRLSIMTSMQKQMLVKLTFF